MNGFVGSRSFRRAGRAPALILGLAAVLTGSAVPTFLRPATAQQRREPPTVQRAPPGAARGKPQATALSSEQVAAELERTQGRIRQSSSAGRFAEAREQSETALLLLRAQYPADHWRIRVAALATQSYARMAELEPPERERMREAVLAFRNGVQLVEEEDPVQAKRQFRRAYLTASELLGPEDEFTALALQESLLLEESLLEGETPKLIVRLVEARKKEPGPQSPAYAMSLALLARARAEQGEYDRAPTYLQTAAKIVQDVEGADRQRLIILDELASALVGAKRPVEAERAARRAIELAGRQPSPHLLLTIRARVELARSLRDQGRREEAADEFKAAAKLFDRLTTRPAQLHAATLRGCATTLEWLGKTDEAKAYRRQLSEVERQLAERPSETSDGPRR